MPNKKQPNWAAWALKFVGSLVYLYVVLQLWNGAAMYVAGTFGSVLFGLAVVASVSLFIVTLASLSMPSGADMMNMWSMKCGMLTGFALLALVVSTSAAWTSTLPLTALVGFILSYLGAGMDMKQ